MTKPWRAAIIGAGFIGEVHARAARLAGATIQAVAASTPESSRSAAAALGATRVLDGSDALTDADDIDVVHVCSPNATHADYVAAALQAGMHVICEKPLAVDAPTATGLVAAAREAGRVGTVPLVYRFYPSIRHARALVGSGALGVVRLIHGGYLQDWLSRPTDWSWRVDPALNGPSRAFADIGTHWCDLVEFVSGHRVTRVMARLATLLPQREVAGHRAAFASGAGDGAPHDVTTEDVALVMFETDEGATGTVTVSQVSPGRKNALRFEIDASEGAVAFDQEHPDELWIGRRDGASIVPRGSEQMAGDAARLSHVPSGHPQGYRESFESFVADSYRAMQGIAVDGLPTFEDGARSVRIIEAVLRSHEAGTWKEVET